MLFAAEGVAHLESAEVVGLLLEVGIGAGASACGASFEALDDEFWDAYIDVLDAPF